VQKEQRKYRPLLRPAEREGAAVRLDLQRPEDAEIEFSRASNLALLPCVFNPRYGWIVRERPA
jgi:hypothetical protein